MPSPLKTKSKAPASSPPRSLWPSREEPEAPPTPQRGGIAIQRIAGSRGRRSAAFPDINIAKTADRIGVTKSHLAKVLAGHNTPSLSLARKVAAVLGTDLQFVASLSTIDSRAKKTHGHKKKEK